MFLWVGEGTLCRGGVPWAVRPFSHYTCLSDRSGQPMPCTRSLQDGRQTGTEPRAGTLVPWGMPGLVFPKRWEQPHPPKPNEELWLRGPFRSTPAIYNPAQAGTGKNQG